MEELGGGIVIEVGALTATVSALNVAYLDS